MKRLRPADIAWAWMRGIATVGLFRDLPFEAKRIINRHEHRQRRDVKREARHAQYREDERRRVRESLETLGLSRNIHEWPK